MPPADLIPVVCPHCGAAFSIDPEVETLVTAPPPDGRPDPDAPMIFRPVCPSCRRRVVVVPP